MKQETYFVVRVSEDGDVSISDYESLDDIAKEYVEDYEDEELPECRDDIGDDLMEWGDKILIIKGHIVVPKTKKVVTAWEE